MSKARAPWRSLTAVAVVLVGAASARATPDPDFQVSAPSPCVATLCAATLTYDGAQMAGPGTIEVEWDHVDPAPFAPDASSPCVPPIGPVAPCTLTGPAYATPGEHTVMLRVTDADGSQATDARPVLVEARPPRDGRPTRPPDDDDSGDDDGAYELCRDTPPNVSCRPGNGMQTAGGGEKVSHAGWPRITGVFWKVGDSTGRRKTGGADNDELLGHHGSDTLDGGAGRDVLWGDWDPSGNTTRQRDVLIGGAGNDFIYPSHGATRVAAGPGKDYIWAFYGKGTIDCGAGYDTVRVRLNGAFRLRNCEKVGHFCQFGADGHGGCLKPGEKREALAERRHAGARPTSAG